jgi:hypothetical protein
MTNFATTARVRLTPEQRAAQPDLADAIGWVRETHQDAVAVVWPRLRSWHKADHLELVEP